MADAASTRDSLARRKMTPKQKILFIAINIGLMVFLRTGYVFFIIGMLPAVVAYYLDVSRQRYTFRSILAANLSGMMPYLTRLISHHASSGELQIIMGSSLTWIVVYGSALMGFLLVAVCPMMAQTMVDALHRGQISRYQRLQKKLENEWGPEVTQFSGDGQQ